MPYQPKVIAYSGTETRRKRWLKAAKVSAEREGFPRRSFSEWAARALDHAADSTLGSAHRGASGGGDHEEET